MENHQHYFRYAELILKHLKEELTPQEKAALETWLGQDERNQALFNKLVEERYVLRELGDYGGGDRQQAIERILNAAVREEDSRLSFRANRLIRYAAVIALFIVAAGVWQVFRMPGGQEEEEVQYGFREDLPPGGNRAVLTLASGQQIDLDGAGMGEIARQFNSVVSKMEEGHIAYDAVSGKEAGADVVYNTVTTPRGGQFRLRLQDGSSVWLNAQSSLRFPARFADGDRVVELTGEAYFEVNPSGNGTEQGKKVPFRVISGKQEVVVLGTHFNVNSYSDEDKITTTLVEGKVKVLRLDNSGEVTLLPGQQAAIDGKRNQTSGEIEVRSVNIDETVAWRHGNFQFRDMDLQTIMRQVARWYDVEVEYQGKMPDIRFRGSMSRNVPVSHLFNILKGSGVNFKIEGKKIIIS